MKTKLLILLMVAALAGCGGGGDDNPAADQSSQADAPVDAVLGMICPDRDADQADCNYQIRDENGNLAAQWEQGQGIAKGATLAPGCYSFTVEQTAVFSNDETETYFAGPREICLNAADNRFIMALDYSTTPSDGQGQAVDETLISAACPDYQLDNAYCIIWLYDGFGNSYNAWLWLPGYILTTDIDPGCYDYTVEYAGYNVDADFIEYDSTPASFCVVENEEIVLDYELNLASD